jgi:hypothetical protein
MGYSTLDDRFRMLVDRIIIFLNEPTSHHLIKKIKDKYI